MFSNVSLLFGGALLAIPIVLHLVMRQQPRHLEFPALRFLKQRKEANQRRMRLRHWVLLALRCLAIAALALTLARPSVASAALGNWLMASGAGSGFVVLAIITALAVMGKRGTGLVAGLAVATAIAALLTLWFGIAAFQKNPGILGDSEAPIAGVMIFDTSPRMQYRLENRSESTTRIKASQDMALWLLKQLPADSEIAVVDSRVGSSVFSFDQGAAQKAIETLESTSAPRSLPQLLANALELIETSEKKRKEIYLFSDLTEAAWQDNGSAQLKKLLVSHPQVSLYIVDVGVLEPQNFALGDLQLSNHTLPTGGTLQISTELSRTGPKGDCAADLYVEEIDPKLPLLTNGVAELPKSRLRRRESAKLEEDGSQALEFDLSGLSVGTHHGWIKLAGDDRLSIDNIRHFTIEVRPPWPVLVAAPAGVNTRFLTEAIATYEFRETGRASFRCDVIKTDELSDHRLSDYAIVYLLDPDPLSPKAWRQLASFAESGKSVAIFLGHNARPLSVFNSPQALEVLPGKLKLQWRAPKIDNQIRPIIIRPRNLSHQMLAEFRQMGAGGSAVRWENIPVFRHWGFDKLAPGTVTVLPFNNGQPAVLERPLGAGRVVVMTTPISDPASPANRSTWNLIPTSPDGVRPYFALVNSMSLYLASSGETRLNYNAGERAVLSAKNVPDLSVYNLFTPMGDKPQRVVVRKGELAIPFTDAPGIYRLKPADGGPVRGFSANLPSKASELARLKPGKLDEILGAERYQLARKREHVNREIGESRVGREFFPLLLLVFAVVIGLEFTLSNRFYKAD